MLNCWRQVEGPNKRNDTYNFYRGLSCASCGLVIGSWEKEEKDRDEKEEKEEKEREEEEEEEKNLQIAIRCLWDLFD